MGDIDNTPLGCEANRIGGTICEETPGDTSVTPLNADVSDENSSIQTVLETPQSTGENVSFDSPPHQKLSEEIVNPNSSEENVLSSSDLRHDNSHDKHSHSISDPSSSSCTVSDPSSSYNISDPSSSEGNKNIQSIDTSIDNTSSKNDENNDSQLKRHLDSDDPVETKPKHQALEVPDKLINNETTADCGALHVVSCNVTSTEEPPDKVFEMYSRPPKLMAKHSDEFSNDENFLKGCKWSPDGTSIMTNSNDNSIRVFNAASMSGEKSQAEHSVLQMKEGDTIYDYAWHPSIKSTDQQTNKIATSSSNSPVHLWDATTGLLTCSYRSYDQADELISPYSLCFPQNGRKLYCGFNKMIHVFDVNRPGRDYSVRPTFADKMGQAGIISCITVNPTNGNEYAAGSYSRSVAVYSEPQGAMQYMFHGQQGGVTQLLWSKDGTKLYAGARKDAELICWDMRWPGQILFVLKRTVNTNQRIYFDLEKSGRYIVSGNHNGSVSVWDTYKTPVQEDDDPVLFPILNFPAHEDVVNGISFNPMDPSLICTGSGQRHFAIHEDFEESEDEEKEETTDNSIKLWSFNVIVDNMES